MPPEKPRTLSLHLRDQANTFFPVYPEEPKNQSRLPLDDQREIRDLINEALEKTLEQFVMLSPNAGDQVWQKWQEVNLLDDLLCRILLRDVSAMAERI